MERRSFLKSSISVCATSVFLSSGRLWAQLNDSELNAYTQRLSNDDLLQLQLPFPTRLVKNPQDIPVEVSLKPVIARRYSSHVYILFELSRGITIFNGLGEQFSSIPLPEKVGHIRDFAVDEKRQRIFIASGNTHSIYVINFHGQIQNIFGEFGIELPHQLSGIKSITSDERGLVHVLNAYSNNVKVFDGQGIYQFSYAPSAFERGATLSSIDGYQTIRLLGGKFRDILYTFDMYGRPAG
ncbi:hypothetical protein [Pseudoalteromonas luteoviolacea]|uniref:6-bladed beta-propeller n=1 Tax=Pseudoalteromonas luteoviolacea NCIMB 1942 TaxID=1365253 RepID=A0A166Y876_9GAMM|nr:hypothetical protein [Pseudoalteromonas luteoviolacea]KZN41545.1 hypothetical protein N482_19910 [Pseudoalteromonas luteoviolacea NCIMB 1942]KZX00208.1 hypothetical protein JL49_12730 [Pseudoalteromonas luteoviolacea]